MRSAIISMAAVEAHLDDDSGWDTVRLSRLLEVHLASPAVALAMDREGELLASVNEARIIHTLAAHTNSSYSHRGNHFSVRKVLCCCLHGFQSYLGRSRTP